MPSFFSSGLDYFATVVGFHAGPKTRGALLFAASAAESALSHKGLSKKNTQLPILTLFRKFADRLLLNSLPVGPILPEPSSPS